MNEKRVQVEHENAMAVSWACEQNVKAKHDQLKTIRRNLLDEVHSLGHRLSSIESDMSRAEDKQQAGDPSEHPLAGLNKQHDEVTKRRDDLKDQVEKLSAVLFA